MAHGHVHKGFWEGLAIEEKTIIVCFFLLGLILLGVGFFMNAGDYHVFDQPFFSARFWERFGQAFMIAWWHWLAPYFIVFEVILLGFFTWAIIGFWPIKPTVKISHTRIKHRVRRTRIKKDPTVARHWAAILHRVKSGTQDAMKYAILEADALVDHVLKKMGLTGEHMADRLTQIIPDQVPSLERAWKAHRLRNELAHTPGMTVTAAETKTALTAFRDFLLELGAL